MSGFERLLSYMRAVSKSKNDQGLRFEQLIKKFFLVSPLYSQLYENVWLWNEFPYNGNKHDYGIFRTCYQAARSTNNCDCR